MGENQSISDFIKNFFENINANVSIDNEIITISKVPKDFEKYIGKSSPFILGFKQEDKINNPEIELINQDSYFLKAIRDYVKELGKTTLLKIDFSDKLQNDLKFDLILANSSVYKQYISDNNQLLKKFTFQITLQYLNQKEIISKEFIIKDKNIIPIDLSLFKLIDGKKDEISLDNLKEDYTFAKDLLKNQVNEIINKTALKLEAKLEKEIQRINKHSLSIISEIQDKINKNEEKINFLLSELSKETSSKEKTTLNDKINKLKEKNTLLNSQINTEDIEKEKNMQIKDEERKHSLDVSTKLINTSLIYYPIFIINATLKNDQVARDISLKFDPLNNIKENILCENCSNQIKNLYLCSGGHINCEKCLKGCNSCNSSLCSKCLIKSCNICSNKICKKCAIQCDSCWKTVCKTHINKDTLLNKNLCSNCSKQCQKCFKFFSKSFVKDHGGILICNNCNASLNVNKFLR